MPVLQLGKLRERNFLISKLCDIASLTWDCCVCSNTSVLLFTVIKAIDIAVIKNPLEIKASVFLIPTPLTQTVLYLTLISAF